MTDRNRDSPHLLAILLKSCEPIPHIQVMPKEQAADKENEVTDVRVWRSIALIPVMPQSQRHR